jgi:hypothetical protein
MGDAPGRSAPEVPQVPAPGPELPSRGATPGQEMPATPPPRPEMPGRRPDTPETPLDPNAPGE